MIDSCVSPLNNPPYPTPLDINILLEKSELFRLRTEGWSNYSNYGGESRA